MANKGGISLGDVAAQYKYKKATVDIKADTETTVSPTVFSLPYSVWLLIAVVSKHRLFTNQVSTKLTFTDVLPSTKATASIKFPDYESGKVTSILIL